MAKKIIAVMGATGAGKSSLIKLVTRDNGIKIGHGLTSETSNITSYPIVLAGHEVVLVDTPGFDDTYRSDGDILRNLVEWLTVTYKAGTRLSGILYLHRIINVRVQGSALRNLRVFRELCGEACFKNVVLCASFWNASVEQESVLESRLEELTNNDGFWGGMIENGSRVFKGTGDRTDAISMILSLLYSDEIELQVQREIVDEGKSMQDTSAVATMMQQVTQEYEARLIEQKKFFEDELRRTESAHSDSVESMHKFYDGRMLQMEEANKRLQEQFHQIKTTLSADANPTNIQQAPLTPIATPSSTFATDVLSSPTSPKDDRHPMSESSKKRMLRYHNFANFISATIQQLQLDKDLDRVKCNLLPAKADISWSALIA